MKFKTYYVVAENGKPHMQDGAPILHTNKRWAQKNCVDGWPGRELVPVTIKAAE